MNIYIDTQFTDQHEDNGLRRLISAAFVTEIGFEFYFESTDGYQEADCSEFVIENVLPHIDFKVFGMSNDEAAHRLKDFIEWFNCPVKFVTDDPEVHINLVCDLMLDRGLTVENLVAEVDLIDRTVIDPLIDEFFKKNRRSIRHFALWDARALEYAYTKSLSIKKS